MPEKLTLKDFTGGLNIRQNSFQVGDNETPEMLNVHVDARGGFVTRSGWARWNTDDIGDPADWNPRNAEIHLYSNGDYAVYVASDGTIWRGSSGAAFTDIGINCNAKPHLADFAAWGDGLYIACGGGSAPAPLPSYRRDAGTQSALTAAGQGEWKDDYTVPTSGVMPQADCIATHGGYIFCASVFEDYDGGGALPYPNRIRWSHPNSPEAWAQLDYIDIEAGGGRITAIRSFTDHLLIFKESSVWALFGYDNESWQLVEVSDETGTVSPTTVTTSESACYFYSSSGRGGIFGMSGGRAPVHLSEPIRLVVSQLRDNDNVWLDWVSQRLFVSLPWLPVRAIDGEPDPVVDGFDGVSPFGEPSNTQTTTFIYDLTIKEGGAWEAIRPARGSLASVLERPGDRLPLAVHIGDPTTSCMLRLGATSQAYDVIDDGGEPIPFLSYYTTNWKDAGMEELLKHWLRPRFIIRNPGETVVLRVDAFRNYDNTSPYRSWSVGVDAKGVPYWRPLGAADPAGDGFDWDDGTKWAAETTGSRIVRGQALGLARSLRLSITSIPDYRNKAWGIDAITLKYNNRRFTT